MKVFGSFFMLFTLGLMGCKTVHHQQAEVLNRQNNITMLKDRVDLAEASNVDVLAPESFSKAKSLLEQALRKAQGSSDPEAGNAAAEDGLKALATAENKAKEARDVLNDALQKRARAEAVHAHLLYEREFSALDRDLKDAGRAIENGHKNFGLEKNTDLAQRYNKLEVAALKANISEIAEAAYADALAANAQRYAPITLKSAKSELAIAKKIIDVEKENFDKAQFHAEQARYLAMRAKYIAELVTGFKKENLTDEQMILWYQTQLEQVHQGLPSEIKFDKSNNEVVERFSSELKHVGAQLNLLETKNIKEARFVEISSMFTADEAEVVRRGDDLIIRSYGFYFPPGKSELVSQNFDLVNKIVTATQKYPNSDIEVEGHTDSSGSKKINKRLSEERAKNVADFLTKVAKIDAHRVTSVGIGDERPIFNNATKEGRAKNRRIEIIIKNAR